MADAKALALSRVAFAPASPGANVPLDSAFARRANPLLISEASEYVQPIERPDASLIAGAPGSYYRDGRNGNGLAFGLTGIETLNRSGQASRTSPLGRQGSAGQ